MVFDESYQPNMEQNRGAVAQIIKYTDSENTHGDPLPQHIKWKINTYNK